MYFYVFLNFLKRQNMDFDEIWILNLEASLELGHQKGFPVSNLH